MELNIWKKEKNCDPVNIPIKKSFGIILCKINYVTNKPEVLLVHKRYTYSYSIFVFGKYAKPGTWSKTSFQFIINLLNQMTTDELLDIWSLNFEQMWYRICLGEYSKDLYQKKYNKFYHSFIKNDNGKGLRDMIKQVKKNNNLYYECPKGRPLNFNETPIDCAIREIKEETGLNKEDYTIIPNVRRYVNYISLGTRYICTYYIAVINQNKKFYRFSIFDNIPQHSEVSETRWFDIDTIRTLDDNKHHLEALVAPAFKIVKKYLKGKWIFRFKEFY